MLSCWRVFAAAGLLVLGVVSGSSALARQADSEEDLLARIEREGNPVKRARYEIRLARVKLRKAIDALDQGHVEQCQQMLGAYLERMRSSWETLQRSGRRASKQPQGFKELDIALREDARLLEDLKRRIPYMDRGPVEEVARGVEQLRSEVLRALFPGEQPPASGKSDVPRKSPFLPLPVTL